ncbi:MAG: glutathione S-transferase family protein [Sphingobium sp.]|nr:glutathione S-transferase family protein [Sphingobium sp.]
MLALYHFGPVANSLTPLLCLIEKNLPFDDRFLNSRLWEHHSPEFRAVNPNGMVPVLVHDGRAITESTVINEYLEDAFPQAPLRPADPFGRAQMRIWTKYVDEYFCPALTVIGAQGAKAYAATIDKDEMAKRLANMPDAEVRKKWEAVSSTGFSDEQLADARGKLGRVVERMESQLAHGADWILGADYSLADIKLYSMAPGLERVLPDRCNAAVSPRLHGWLRRMEARPAVQAMRAREYRR